MKATDLEGALSPYLTFRIQAILAGTLSVMESPISAAICGDYFGRLF